MASAQQDTQLLSIGQQCSEPTCLLVDFLPFKCQHCSRSFCGNHFLVAAHRCPQYDETKHDRVAPSCPLCNTPVAIPPGEDPNIRMERHITTDCNVTTGKSGRARSQPVCARGKCGKVLYAPIACSACKKQYCPQHRFPKDHSCSSLKPAAMSSSSSHSSSSSARPKPSVKAKTTTTQTSDASTHLLPPSSRILTPSNTAFSNPFSKTDRTLISASFTSISASTSTPSSPMMESKPSPIECRTRSNSQIAAILDPFRGKAERESRRKAMLERSKKGLLTEQEKILLAEEEAQRAKELSSNTDKSDCTIM